MSPIAVATVDLIDAADGRWQRRDRRRRVLRARRWRIAVDPWLRRLAGRGGLVLLGDPGRAYLPQAGLRERARYTVPTSLELEDRESRDGIVWEVMADCGPS